MDSGPAVSVGDNLPNTCSNAVIIHRRVARTSAIRRGQFEHRVRRAPHDLCLDARSERFQNRPRPERGDRDLLCPGATVRGAERLAQPVPEFCLSHRQAATDARTGSTVTDA